MYRTVQAIAVFVFQLRLIRFLFFLHVTSTLERSLALTRSIQSPVVVGPFFSSLSRSDPGVSFNQQLLIDLLGKLVARLQPVLF